MGDLLYLFVMASDPKRQAPLQSYVEDYQYADDIQLYISTLTCFSDIVDGQSQCL